MNLLIKRKQKKFLKLYEPVHDRFERFCRARAYGDMPYQDLMNETLFVAFKKAGELKNEKAFLSYLIGISVKLLANANRKKKAETTVDEFVLNEYSIRDNEVDRMFDVEILHLALSKLPDLQREAVTLFEITGFNIKEIMDIQNSSESAVKQRLFRARRELARIMKEEFMYEYHEAK